MALGIQCQHMGIVDKTTFPKYVGNFQSDDQRSALLRDVEHIHVEEL